ncbi:COG3014 family protein [Aeromonas bivalvium]|uniref:COG3014 family protein n=1 Tax=Aeromonas bivalvium TaxID=440079 RepID=UPI000DD06992|nr:hypothetical protein [Aeromonas bivalvium]
MRLLASTGLLLAGLLLGGCASWQDLFVSYSVQMAPVRSALLQGRALDAMAEVRELAPGDDGYVLSRLELGRIAQLARQDPASRQAWVAADRALTAQDEQARFRVSQGLAQAGSLLTNDQTLGYQTPDYERTMLHHYLALDYLARGDREGALVEVRRANLVQERALRERDGELAKAKAQAGVRQALSRAPDLDRLVGQVKNGFQNAYTFYLSGVLYEASGDLNDAWVDYGRALEIAPDNPALQGALLRLARLRGSPEELEQTERRLGRKAPPLARGEGRVVILFEDGLIPARRELFLPLPLFTSAGDFRTFTVAIPYYDNRGADVGPLRVGVAGQAGTTAPLVRLEALAARDLQERLPAMLSRQALRLLAKEQLRRTAAKEGGDVGNLVVGLFNTFSERADTRSWLTLPAQASSWEASLPAGRQSLILGAGSASQTLPIEVRAGRTTLIWANRLGAALTTRVLTL